MKHWDGAAGVKSPEKGLWDGVEEVESPEMRLWDGAAGVKLWDEVSRAGALGWGRGGEALGVRLWVGLWDKAPEVCFSH